MAPIHDSKEVLRFRAVCDERITLPLSSLRAFDSVYTKLVAGLSKSSMVEIKVKWRCNVVHDWVEPVPQEAAGALYDRLGYSQDLITQLGCSPPLGASGPGGGAAKESAEEGRQLGGEPALRFAQLLELSGHSGGPTDGLLQRPVASAAGRLPSLCPRGTWPTFGIAYGSSSWRLQTASSARTFLRWRMSGTARTN